MKHPLQLIKPFAFAMLCLGQLVEQWSVRRPFFFCPPCVRHKLLQMMHEQHAAERQTFRYAWQSWADACPPFNWKGFWFWAGLTSLVLVSLALPEKWMDITSKGLISCGFGLVILGESLKARQKGK